MKSIGVLITNYQSWPLTERAIREVLRWSGNSIARIVVVDDASDAPVVFAESDKVVIHRNAENFGYARSVNIGMRLLNDDFVLFLDCDAYPLMDLVPEMIRHFQAVPRLGALGFFEMGADGKTRIAGDGEPTLMNFLLGQALGARCARKGWFTGRRFVLHSCCMAVRRAAFEQINGFDREFDFLDADTDFSMRLLDAGWLIKTDENLKCFHQGSGSPQATARRVVRHHRNRWLLLRKHGKIRFKFLCRAILLMRHFTEWFLLQGKLMLSAGNRGEVADKLKGRKELLRLVLRDYEN
jgi:GT2 family glycosyltransferase